MNYKKVHFIGIGGIGMSGLARLYLHEGVEVTGSDANETENTKKLEAEGVTISYKQDGELIKSEDEAVAPDLIVYTEAMAEDHPEMVVARESGARMVNYFEALSEVANEYYLIAIAGTHGKTTTTAMLIDILEEASFDPTAIVGSLRTKTGSNFRAGKSKYFVVEACEYKRDFLYLNPEVLLITNLEHEHTDYYKDLESVQEAFKEFVAKVPEEGCIISDKQNLNLEPVLKEAKAEVIDYRPYIDLDMELHQPGLHNRQNAAAAMATADYLGIEKDIVLSALRNFAGTARRFEYKGKCNGALVYDEYAHHPTEIEASIRGARELYPDKKLTVIFQPHTYSRTESLYDDFISALAKADRVIMVPIYKARKSDVAEVSSEQMAEDLKQKGVESSFFYTLEAAALEVKEAVGSEDVVMVIGAGDVTKVAIDLTG